MGTMTTNKGRELAIALGMTDYGQVQRCSAICRHAATFKRLAETACNRELTPAEEKKDKRIEEMLSDLIRGLGEGYAPLFQGDPRGATVKIKCPDGRTDDFESTGICVPGS